VFTSAPQKIKVTTLVILVNEVYCCFVTQTSQLSRAMRLLQRRIESTGGSSARQDRRREWA